MSKISFYNKSILDKFINRREGEIKFGECVQTISSIKALEKSPAKYVIFGIPEDVGIRGNFGKPGAATTWNSFLLSFLNIQSNPYNKPENCLILGHLNCDEYMTDAEKIIEEEEEPQRQLGLIAERIDAEVINLVKMIVAVQKIPVIIGGGHNNSYGNIVGTSKGLNKPINILNIDAHTDLRRTDYRHSGNGFSFAKEKGSLDKYAMFGIYKNYTPQYIFDRYRTDDKVKIYLFEDFILKPIAEALQQFNRAIDFLDNEFGLEIDCDAIQDFSSSAMTPCGFTIREIRQFIAQTQTGKVHYLHLTEAAAKDDPQIGKALSYLVSDFMRL